MSEPRLQPFPHLPLSAVRGQETTREALSRLPFTLLSLQLNASQIFALGFFLLGLVLLTLRRRAFREGLAVAKTQGK